MSIICNECRTCVTHELTAERLTQYEYSFHRQLFEYSFRRQLFLSLNISNSFTEFLAAFYPTGLKNVA